MRALAASASSRLTLLPLRTSASEERRSVSFMTSAPKRSPRRPTAVRQTPLTAIESPSESSRASGDSMARRTPSLVEWTSATVPRSATRPVNNPLPLPQARGEQHVARHLLAVEGQRPQRIGDRVDALALQGVARRPPAEQQWSDEEPQLVDLAAVEEGAGQVRPALEEDRGDRWVQGAELVQRRAHARGLVLAGGDDHVCARVLQRVGVRAPRRPRDDDDERDLVCGRDELGVQRQARGGIEDDAPRLMAHAVDPRGEL